jgi:phospholipid transport system substrate-binding protein
MAIRHARGLAFWGLGLAAFIGFAGPAPAQAPRDAGAVIADFDHSLLDVMQHAGQLGYRGRYQALAPVIDQSFDTRTMTRIAIGAGWSSLSADQQDQLARAFCDFITATYARRFDGYSGEKFESLGEKPVGAGMLVETRLVKQDGEPIALNYVTHQNSGQWQIVDVFLTGTISELAQRRSEFSAVFQREGFQGLLTSLRQKVAQAESESHLS